MLCHRQFYPNDVWYFRLAAGQISTKELTEVEESLKKLHEALPQPNKYIGVLLWPSLIIFNHSLFLRSIVGSINVTIPNSEDK